MIPWLDPGEPFPPVEAALPEPNGLLAAGADLSLDTLIDAYSHGIFPWFGDDDPLLWWSPDPRMVLHVDRLHVSRSLRRTMRARRYVVTFDRAFSDVVAECAAPRHEDTGTWITSEMRDAYGRLAGVGLAHSVETWAGDRLAGGLYGVAIGRMFYGESMFSRADDASKVALATLVAHLRAWRFEMIDCQMSTTHLASLGATQVPRTAFVRDVRRLVEQPGVVAPWHVDPGVQCP